MDPLASQHRSERLLIEKTRQRIREQRWLRGHVFLIALCTLSCLALGGTLLRNAGMESLAGRYAVLLPLTYLVYLGLLRVWAAYLVSREHIGADGLDLATELPVPRRGLRAEPEVRSGCGGEFGGGGASGDFGPSGEMGSAITDLGGKTLETGGDLLGALDDGAVVALPLLAVMAMAGLLAALLGAGVFVLFGVEVLLTVAVEVALAALVGGFAWRRQREGWLSQAVGHTWRAALASVLLGVALGAAVDHWLPEARSLPHALSLWRRS